MDNKITDFNIIHSDNEVQMPEECEQSEKAIEKLSDENSKSHYESINLLVLAVVFVFAFVCFIALGGEDSSDEDKVNLTAKNFLSGEYCKNLEESYNKNIPFPEQMKSAEERISLLYGIGNRISDSVLPNNNSVDEDIPNAFDDNSSDDSSDNANENIITTKVPEDDSSSKSDKKTSAATTKNKTAEETEETTTAIPHPETEETEETTPEATTTTAATTLPVTNNNPPKVTHTTTVMYTKPTATTTKKEPEPEETPNEDDLEPEVPAE